MSQHPVMTLTAAFALGASFQILPEHFDITSVVAVGVVFGAAAHLVASITGHDPHRASTLAGRWGAGAAVIYLIIGLITQ